MPRLDLNSVILRVGDRYVSLRVTNTSKLNLDRKGHQYLCSWKLHEPHQECELVSHQMLPSVSFHRMGSTVNTRYKEKGNVRLTCYNK
jgi:hypothetical protein